MGAAENYTRHIAVPVPRNKVLVSPLSTRIPCQRCHRDPRPTAEWILERRSTHERRLRGPMPDGDHIVHSVAWKLVQQVCIYHGLHGPIRSPQ